MSRNYIFKAMPKRQKNKWRIIQINEDHTFYQFDNLLREAFNNDLYDHLSAFSFSGGRNMEDIARIYPDGTGDGAQTKVGSYNFECGEKLEYTYDFGANIRYVLVLESITSDEESLEDPQILAQSRTRRKFCVKCKKNNEKIEANWYCHECSIEMHKRAYLCDSCAEEDSDWHRIEEIA